MKARDQYPLVSAQRAVQVALAGLDGIQTFPPGEQVAGVVLLAYVMCQTLGVNVSEAFNQAQRRYDDSKEFAVEAQALTDYVNGELR